VLSKEALTRFIENGFHNNAMCREDGGAEDAEFGKCELSLSLPLSPPPFSPPLSPPLSWQM